MSSRTWALKNSSNVDDDATHPSVTRASARTKGKKHAASNVSVVPIDGVSFHTEEGATQWK